MDRLVVLQRLIWNQNWLKRPLPSANFVIIVNLHTDDICSLRPLNPLKFAFTSPQDELLSQKTIELFPSHVSVLEINLPSGADTSEIIGVIDAILITETVAEARGIDPGQPEVTKFGT